MNIGKNISKNISKYKYLIERQISKLRNKFRYKDIDKTMATMVLIVLIINVFITIHVLNSKFGERANKEEKIKQYVVAVYAPKNIEQFDNAYKDSIERKIFTEEVAKRFFVKYGNELNDADKQRKCEVYISYGEPQNQSDNRGRYLVKALLYEEVYTEPRVVNFVFLLNENEETVIDYNIYK